MENKTKKSTHETGHAKNVANFEDVIAFCTGYGAKYNPSLNRITIVELNSILTNALNELNNVNTALAPWTIAINERQSAYEPISKLTTRLISALDASGDNHKIVEDARTIARKITGARKSKKIENPDPDDKKSISTSQQSYDSRLENFTKLKILLAEVTEYAPNETELQIATLETLISDLIAKNTAVISTTTPLSNARIERDKVLYAKSTGLVDIAYEVKKYVKSVYGTSAPEYKQISSIRFSRS